MQILDPDILDLTRQLSPSIPVVAVLVGLFLWMFGAYSHRFWLAMAVTVAAGVIGLFAGRDFGVQPLVAALLLALSAGVLSLSLARVALFLAGGLMAVLLMRAGRVEWNEFVCFLAGGLAGVLMYRLWVMALSALVGTLLVSYAILSLLDICGLFDSVDFSTRNAPLLNWSVAGVVALGIVVQFVFDRRQGEKKANAKPAKGKKITVAPQQAAPAPPPKAKWWQVGGWFEDRAA
jgi:hypothetical protein